MFEIGIQTAKAVAAIKLQASILLSNPATAALAGLAFAQIPFAIGTGAASIAAVLAKPIPRYKDGLDKANSDHLAVVGDGGKHEIHEHADGSISLTPKTDTLTMVKKGDRIHKDANEWLKGYTLAAMRDSQIKGVVTEKNYGEEMTRKLTAELKGVGNIIKNKKEMHLNSSHAGVEMILKSGFNYIKYVENNANF